MQILILGNFGTGWDGSICDEEHIAKALENLGHEVTRLQREQVGAFTGRYDFILISQWDGYPVNLITTLKTNTLGALVVYWAFDHQDQTQEWHSRLVAQADLYLSKRIADSIYPNWQWLPQDFAPEFLDKAYEPAEYDVVFTGSYLPWATKRTETLKAVDKAFDLHIFSVTPDQWREQGLKNVHGPIMDHGLPELYAKARINLSIDHTIEAGYWSDRNAQIMACGGFVLFHYVPLSEAVFRDNLAYFYDQEDCLEKIAYYLEEIPEREIIADKGYDFAQSDLKVSNRVKDLLTIVRAHL